jgi:hypothetical protein
MRLILLWLGKDLLKSCYALNFWKLYLLLLLGLVISIAIINININRFIVFGFIRKNIGRFV